MKLLKLDAGRDLYLLFLIPLLFIPFFLLESQVTVLLGVYILILAAFFLPVFYRLRKWWLPGILGLVILLPGPMDRMFLSVQLTPEEGANPYGIFSVIDIMMFLAVFIKLKDE